MKTRTFLTFLALSIVVFSCSLNAEQEASLNQHLSNYLRARNGCMLVGIVGFTHPDYIRELKDQGDSVLLKSIDCQGNYERGIKFTDPTLRKTETEGNKIHVYYELDLENGADGTIERRKEGLFAISEDNGKSWYFLTREVYKNKGICKSLNRLIETK